MPSETGIAFGILLSAGALVAVVQLLPPLTSYEPPVNSKNRQGEYIVDEYAWCDENMPGMDCGCFAARAREVMSEDSPRVQGWSYADKWQLALSQAGDNCS